MKAPAGRTHQRGAAIIVALITVISVAVLAAAALWQQWRAFEVEAAERARQQSAWVLLGALDWSRLILLEDGRTGGADHLGEVWSVDLAEAKLSSFLGADENLPEGSVDDAPEAFLAGQIRDAQAKLNARNLVEAGRPAMAAMLAFKKLFVLLSLPVEQVDTMVEGLVRADAQSSSSPLSAAGQSESGEATSPVAWDADHEGLLMPQRFEDLAWLGLPASTLATIEPYVTLLPMPTPLNINTASVQAIYVSVPGMDMSQAQRVVAARRGQFFATLGQANELLQSSNLRFVAGQHSVATQHFDVCGRLRIDTTWMEERSLVWRNGASTAVLWRARVAGR